VKPRVLIIGFGNPLRGDDGLGRAVADWAAGVARDHGSGKAFGEADVDVVAPIELTPDLAEAMSRADVVVFIDACTYGEPGDVNCEAVVASKPRSESLTHHTGPGTLLALTDELYSRNPRAFVLSVAGQEFGLHEGLSRPVKKALPELRRRLARLVRETLSTTDHEKWS